MSQQVNDLLSIKDTAKKVREAQGRYFKDRSMKNLGEARALEQRLDKMLKAYDEHYSKPNLFGDATDY